VTANIRNIRRPHCARRAVFDSVKAKFTIPRETVNFVNFVSQAPLKLNKKAARRALAPRRLHSSCL